MTDRDFKIQQRALAQALDLVEHWKARAEAAEKALAEARKQADSFAHSAMNSRNEVRLIQDINSKLQAQLIASSTTVDALRQERDAMLAEQRKSWVRGEMAFGDEGTRLKKNKT